MLSFLLNKIANKEAMFFLNYDDYATRLQYIIRNQ